MEARGQVTSGPAIIIAGQHTRAKEAMKEAPGRKYGRASGGWIHDLCAQKAVVLLCPLCTHKFNPGRLGYVKDRCFPIAIGKCDGCDVQDNKCSAYFWEETYETLRDTPEAQRKRKKTRDAALKEGSMKLIRLQPASLRRAGKGEF